jgi:hypothetical protein
MTTMHSAAQHRGTANTGNDLFGDKSSPRGGDGDGDDGRNGFLSRWCHPMILEPDSFVSRVTVRRDSVRIPDFVCLSVLLLCGSVVRRTGTALRSLRVNFNKTSSLLENQFFFSKPSFASHQSGINRNEKEPTAPIARHNIGGGDEQGGAQPQLQLQLLRFARPFPGPASVA